MKQILKNSYLYSSALFVFAVALIRADFASFTYDEVYTHDYYVLAMDFFNVDVIKAIFSPEYCLANNHLLNSFLMKVFEDLCGISYSELILRLPNLLFFAVLLMYMICCVKDKTLNVLEYSFFIFLYYLNEFFSLARGYGMCVCLIFFALVQFDKAAKSQFKNFRHITLALLFFSAAATANTLALLIIVPFGMFCVIRLVQTKNFGNYMKKQWFFSLPLSALILLMVKYHFMVTGKGKPTHMTEEGFFRVILMDFVSKYENNSVFVVLVSVLLLLSGAITLLIVRKKIWEKSFQIPFFLFIIEMLAVEYGFDFLPYGRAVLPMYPLFLFVLFENFRTWQGVFTLKYGKYKISDRIQSMCGTGVQTVLVMLLFAGFVRQINFYTVQEWPKYAEYKRIAYHTLYTRTGGNEEVKNASYPMTWYRDKIMSEYQYDILKEEQ